MVARPLLADEPPSATPYRPTVSNPADLPTPGWLELEWGAQRDKTDGAHEVSWPYLFKYAFTPEWGLLLGGDAYVRATSTDGSSTSGFGDTELSLKHRIPVTDDEAFGVEAGVRLPTAKTGLGSDKTDCILKGIFSRDVATVHLDINLGPTRIGAPEPGTGRLAWNGSAALSTNLNAGWGMTGELSGTRRQGTAAQSQLLFAVTYAANKRTVFDVGFAKGLTDASQDYTIFAGITTMLGRLH